MSRILALGGVAITLAGVVMLLVLAGRAGLLRPEVRVGAGALLAVGLVGLAGRVAGRPGGRVGGVALAATGFAAGYLDIIAVTTYYGWVPSGVGLGLAALVSAAGVWTALRWDSIQLAAIVTVACALTAPALTRGLTMSLVLFYLVLQAAGAVPELRRGWSGLAPLRTLPVVGALMARLSLDSISFSDPTRPSATTLVVAALVAVVGIGSGIVAVGGRRSPSRPDVTAMSAGVAGVPLLYAAWLSERGQALGIGFGTFAACVVGLLVLRRIDDRVRTVLASVGGIALLVGCLNLPGAHGRAAALPFLAVAVIAAALATRTISWYVRGYAAVYGLLGLLATADAIGLRPLADEGAGVAQLGWTAVATGLLVGAFAGLTAIAVGRSGLATRWPQAFLVCGVLGLYAVTVVSVAVPVAITRDEAAFHLGHFVATTLWVLAGSATLGAGLARPGLARLCLVGGLATLGAAVGKLVTYDLASLSGFTRAATFLVTGLLLLLAGTRYARAFGEQASSTSSEGPDDQDAGEDTLRTVSGARS